MNFQQIKSFFSKKEQIKVMYEGLKKDKEDYFSFLIAENKIVNPFIISKAFVILKKDIPEGESYWWTRKTYWFDCILMGIVFLLFTPLSFFNAYVGIPFILVSSISLVYTMNKKMRQSADFCHLLFKDKEHVLFFKNWILQEYSKIEKKEIICKAKNQSIISQTRRRL